MKKLVFAVIAAVAMGDLLAPPTGYSYGVVVTTLAALLRGNKIIVKDVQW